jgi:hypothetical protein
MGSFLISPVQYASQHALPFRTIFEEHRQRRPDDLRKAVRDGLRDSAGKPIEIAPDAELDKLLDLITQQEQAYADLQSANFNIACDAPLSTDLDDLESACSALDFQLKLILHEMDSSALCLSGGGIRSASVCLGVLEGLSRFSRLEVSPTARTTPSSKNSPASDDLMSKLDYLSTVSGGGYIGSWMMSWTYRRMDQARPIATSLNKPYNAARQSLLDCQARCNDLTVALASTHPGTSATSTQQLATQLQAVLDACTRAYGKATKLLDAANPFATQQKSNAKLFANARQSADAINASSTKLNAYKKTDLAQSRNALLVDLATVNNTTTSLINTLAALRTPNWNKAYNEVIDALAGQRPVTAGDPEPQPVRYLRSYTSFLAPALGLTLDTFTLAAIVLRNLIVNWTMLIPALFFVVMLPQFSRFFLIFSMATFGQGSTVPPIIVAILFGFAAVAAGFALPSHHKLDCRTLFLKFSVPIFVGAVLGGCWLLTVSWHTDPSSSLGHPLFQTLTVREVIAFIGFQTLSVFLVLAYSEKIAEGTDTHFIWRTRTATWILSGLTAIVVSSLTVSLLTLLQLKVFPWLLHPSGSSLFTSLATGQRLYVLLAFPLIITVLLISSSLYSAFLGLYEVEEDREWWVRCGGILLGFNILWVLAHGIAMYGQGGFHRLIAGVAGIVLGGATSAIGFSGATAAGPRPVKVEQLGTMGRFFQKHNLLLPAISFVALILINIGAVAAIESIRQAILPLLSVHRLTGDLRSSLIVLASTGALAIIINRAININLFSLHGMYRMRLMRAFLGASNLLRHPNPFTDFDHKDSPYETDLPAAEHAPLHIINTTLNLVGTSKTAWRQRRAECFTFSPIHSGSWRIGYVPTCSYSGPRGPSLATTMAISGAAFNPNMGYQSSPLLSLIMTFFNVRLGWWLPNPKRAHDPQFPLSARDAEFLCKPGPSFALQPLVEEALGLTDDRFRWIELTDGGHFENLGLYEMVMRRCRQIIVVDVGADPKCLFEDLGNAIRKIRIDLGVPIKFPPHMKMQSGMHPTNAYCAVAEIDYSAVDAQPGDDPSLFKGTLVYIKAGITGHEPADILQYAKTHDTFPHETTANQFFNESQFESYRHLGAFMVESITAPTLPPTQNPPRTMAHFIQLAGMYANSIVTKAPSEPSK